MGTPATGRRPGQHGDSTQSAERMLRVARLREDGWRVSQIARELGISEGTVRYYLRRRRTERFFQRVTPARFMRDSRSRESRGNHAGITQKGQVLRLPPGVDAG